MNIQLNSAYFPRWKEYAAAGLALTAFLAYPWISRRVDITSAPIDPGALSVVIMAIFAVLVFIVLAWWLMRNMWPVLATYMDQQFETHFKRLNSCQKIIISLSFYLLLLYAFVATLAALM